MFKGKNKYWSAGLLICLGLGPLSCTGESPGAETASHEGESSEELPEGVVELTPEQIRQGDIQIQESKLIELREYLETTGNVTPNEARVAHIRPIARGVVERVYVRRGDRVSRSDPLILYDNIELGELIGEFRSRQSQLQRYRAELEVAEKFWERGVELLEVQAIAEKEVELREAQFKNARAMVESQRSEIAQTEEKLHRFGLSEEEIRELGNRGGGVEHRTASHNTLRAPFPGTIIGFNVAEGELVETSRELMTLADVSTVWVLADVYEKDLGQIREGQAVEIVSVSYPDRVFQGHLTYISDVLEKETRTAQVRCVVSNTENLLKLAMFVTVRVPTIREKTAVAVAAEAVQNLDGQDVVFVAEGAGRFRRMAVTTGLKADGWVEVGVPEGIKVVSNGSFYLKSALKRSEIEPEHGH